MPEFDKTNTVNVNKNDKGGVETRADLKLDLNIDGVRYFAKAWARTSNGETFYSGPVERADEKYQPNGVPVAAGIDPSDEIPF